MRIVVEIKAHAWCTAENTDMRDLNIVNITIFLGTFKLSVINTYPIP